MISAIKCNKRNYIILLAINVFLMFLFYNSFYWVESGINIRKVIEVVIIVFFVVVVPVLFVYVKRINEWINDRFSSLFLFLGKIKQNKKKAIIYIAILVLIGPVVYLIGSRITNNPYVSCMVATIIYILFFLYMLRDFAEKRTEIIFAVIALSLGIFQIIVTPPVPGIMADDEIHYERTLTLSNVFNGIFYEAENVAIEDYANVILEKETYDKESRANKIQLLEKMYSSKSIVQHGFGNRGVWSVGYIPSAIGIILAKGLSLNFVSTYMVGKFFNLLAYVGIMYFAIKKLKYGKILFTTIGLIPSMIFIASNFTYDAWLFAFIALGFSYFISMIQSSEKIKNVDIIKMNIFFFVGMLAKAAYLFMLLPLLFMPKNKFDKKKQRALYYITAIIMVLMLLLTFVVPMLFNTGVQSDARGGSDVDSTSQIAYILSNPADYLKTLGVFLNHYLSLSSFGNVIQWYAYLGTGVFYVLTLIILVLTAFIDKGNNKQHILPIRISTVVSYVITAGMIATALYISFTPVGANTVAGCQSRYILPLLIPLLAFIFPGIRNMEINKKKYVIVVVLLLALTFIFNIYSLSIKLYV